MKIFFESLGFNIGIFFKSLIFQDLDHGNIHMIKSTQLKLLRFFKILNVAYLIHGNWNIHIMSSKDQLERNNN